MDRPGCSEVVSRLFWEQEIAGADPVTQISLKKTRCGLKVSRLVRDQDIMEVRFLSSRLTLIPTASPDHAKAGRQPRWHPGRGQPTYRARGVGGWFVIDHQEG